MPGETTNKPKVASDWLAGCAGCHMSLLDMDERIIALLEKVQLTSTPITDLKHPPEEGVDVGIIEGAVNNSATEATLRQMRARCKCLVALGDCAVFGGVPAMRNAACMKQALERAYVQTESTVNGKIPDGADIASMQDTRAIDQVVKVDVYLPGCPPSADAIVHVLQELAEGQSPEAARHELGLALRERPFPGVSMSRKIVIEPVTRIEGHAKVSVYLDDAGKVDRAVLHVNEFRGFEKFCEGRLFFEMPLITERICGICPGEPSPCVDQGVRSDRRRRSAEAREAPARTDAHGADHSVSRDALFRAGRAGLAPRLRRRAGSAECPRGCTRWTRNWRPKASSCASLGRRSSRFWGRAPGCIPASQCPEVFVLHFSRRRATRSVSNFPRCSN